MRLILSTIILTMLAQPVQAISVEQLITSCTTWKETGFSEDFEVSHSGMDSLSCFVYMHAISNAGKQNCYSDGIAPERLSWEATAAQLSQFLLNEAEKKPEEWEAFGYSFLVSNFVNKTFPCKE